MLIHMSKGEVKSLNDLAMAHGGHLTINPDTGLPEAGFLSSLLPMLAGGALTVMSGGAINPLTAGLLIGGGTAAVTGDIKKGLMAGLGAYGGAGIGTGLAASGTQAAAVQPSFTPPTPAVPPAPPVESIMTQPPSVTPLTDSISTVPDTTQMFNKTTSGFGPPAPSGLSGPSITADSLGYKPLTPAPNMVTTPAANAAYESSLADQQAAFRNGSFGDNLSTVGKGAQTLTQPGGFDNFMTNLENTPYTYGPKTTLAAAALPTAYSMYEDSKPKRETTPVDSDPGQQYDYMANPTDPNPYASMSGQENKYFNPQYVKRSTPRFADGGLSDAHYNLGGYSDGGRLLRGPGDGVSDSIPAVIGKKQPARLADGEFVVPARIVSELGNGSTEAGARKLYAMMDRIQKARGSTVGRGRVAKNSRAEKYLPA
jgi:hypothetical protein